MICISDNWNKKYVSALIWYQDFLIWTINDEKRVILEVCPTIFLRVSLISNFYINKLDNFT